MAEKRVTIQDIATKLGMAKSTVSKALSGATDINDQTRERVLSCAGEMGYRIKQGRTTFSKHILVFIYGIHYNKAGQFGYEILLGIQTAAAEQSIGVDIAAINDEELKDGSYYSMLSSSYEGIVFLGFKPHRIFVEHIKGMNIPMVVLDNNVDCPMTARVGCDNADGIRRIVRYLYSKGHDKIGFLGGEEDSIVTAERKSAYSKALLELGLEENPSSVRYGHFSGKGTKKRILDIAQSGATAVVCISDLIACKAVQELTKAGYSVPNDISITGYDNLPFSEYSQPPITTMNQNRIHLGRTIFSVIQQMKSGIDILSVMIRPVLVERESVLTIAEREIPEEDDE